MFFHPLKPFRHLSDFRFTLKFNIKNCMLLGVLFAVFLYCYQVKTDFLREYLTSKHFLTWDTYYWIVTITCQILSVGTEDSEVIFILWDSRALCHPWIYALSMFWPCVLINLNSGFHKKEDMEHVMQYYFTL